MRRTAKLVFLCGMVAVTTAVAIVAWAATKHGKISSVRSEHRRLCIHGRVGEKQHGGKYSRDAEGYLGCTFYHGGETFDQGDIPVYGTFDEFFDYSGFNGGRYSIALWGRRVDREECAHRRGGRCCSYCRENGYHLEQRLASRSGNVPER